MEVQCQAGQIIKRRTTSVSDRACGRSAGLKRLVLRLVDTVGYRHSHSVSAHLTVRLDPSTIRRYFHRRPQVTIALDIDEKLITTFMAFSKGTPHGHRFCQSRALC